MKDCACSMRHRNRDRACASDDHANAHFLAPDDRVNALLPANTRLPQTQRPCRFTATRMHDAMNRARARDAMFGIGTNACIDADASERARRKKRCVDATTRARFRATNTSKRALATTSTCASTPRARMTHAYDAMHACRWMAKTVGRTRAHRHTASRMPRIARNQTCRSCP